MPWSQLHKRNMYNHAIKEKVWVPPPLENHSGDLFKSIPRIVESFFSRSNPKLSYLGHYVEYWVYTFTTDMCFRCDHNNVMKIFKYARGDIPYPVWATLLKNSSADDWVYVPSERGYKYFIKITTQCNDVYNVLMLRLRRLDLTGPYTENVFNNLQRLPDFVPFQQNRKLAHTEYRVRFQARKRGGNGGYLPSAKTIRLPKPSIQQMMCEFDDWLHN